MAIQHNHQPADGPDHDGCAACAEYYGTAVDHIAWPVDELPRLAADIHRVVATLLVYGVKPAIIDDVIDGLLRGATPDAAPVPAAG